jgi:hypothetical protein
LKAFYAKFFWLGKSYSIKQESINIILFFY